MNQNDSPGQTREMAAEIATENRLSLGPEVHSRSDPGTDDRRTVAARIIRDELEAECHFWVGLAKVGTATAGELLQESQKGIREMFGLASTKGIEDSKPLMISDCQRVPPRFLYLLQLPEQGFRERAIWLGEMAKTLRQMNPASVGLYISPDIIDAEVATELTLQVLRELVSTTKIDDYYLLLGEHGLNRVLNSLLNLKEELRQDAMNLLAFH